MRRIMRVAFSLVLAFAAFVYLNNTNMLATPSAQGPQLLAHRGLHQTFPSENLKADTCTATRIYPPEHAFLENTLASMRAAFAAGAHIVEIDVHRTADGHFAVFHDWTLDCRTNGHGVTRERTLAELKALDIGYGYTADGGKTFPFRGKGIGLMPSLDDVLAAFPGQRFLIDIKSNDPEEGRALAQRLLSLPAKQRALFMVHGGEGAVTAVLKEVPELLAAKRSGLKACLLWYFVAGWSGVVPAACKQSIVLVPLNYAHWLWGWPDRFLNRMQAASSLVFVLGPWDGEGFSRGVDTASEFSQIPRGYRGGIWTNRVDRIATLVSR